jgi:large subunit ribosomal protein L4
MATKATPAVRTLSGGSVSDGALASDAFGTNLRPVVLREAVLMYEANKRVGTAQTRTRRFVSGTSHKMYRQKHTGRARHGDRKAPLFRGGGVAHGPHPRDFSYAMPKKALRRALQVALALKLRDGEISLWEGAQFDKPSTKAVSTSLDALGAGRSAMLVTGGPVDENLRLSVRNLTRVDILPAEQINAYHVVLRDNLILLDGAVEALQARIKDDEDGGAA